MNPSDSELSALKIDRRPRDSSADGGARTPRRRASPWPLRLVAVAIVVAIGWLFWAPIRGWIDSLRLPEVTVQRVTLSHPASVGAIQGAAANGYVVAARRAALSADTPGRIVEMLVTEGSVVREGDVVARLYSEEYAAAVARAVADLDAAEAELRGAAAALEAAELRVVMRERDLEAARADVVDTKSAAQLAELQLERVRGLFESRIASQREIDVQLEAKERADAQRSRSAALELAAEAGKLAAATDVRRAIADVEAASARRDVATARVTEARATLDKTNVRAPFDGIVVLKDAEVGEVVSPNSQGGSTARGAVCTMVDFDSLEVQADVPETNLAAVRVGAPARIFLDAYPDRSYAGRVDRIWPTADRQKATIEVRVAFDRRDEVLRPDMGVRVVFDPVGDVPGDPASGSDGTGASEPRTPQILIPENAVVTIGGADGVFVLERDLVTFTPVTLAEQRGGRVVVTEGLREGQTIVISPPTRLSSGDRVAVASAP